MEQFQIGCLLKMITDKIKIQGRCRSRAAGADADAKPRAGLSRSRSGGQATQKEIEGFLQVSHPTVAGIINRMEQNGFVRCRLDPADKAQQDRQPDGARCRGRAGYARHRCQTTEQQMLRSLTPEQIAALESALRTIYADLG